MDKAIANAKALCPEVDTKNLIISIYNDSIYPEPTIDLPRLICRLNQFNTYYYGNYFAVNAWTWFAGVCLGLPSCVLALVTFCRSEFGSVSFLYHRGINLIQLVYTFVMLGGFLKLYLGEQYVRSSLFMTLFSTYVFGKLDAALPHAIEIIIVWVAIERALLCNSPRGFAKVDHRPLGWGIMMGAMLVATLIYLPTAFTNTYQYNNMTADYDRPGTAFRATPFYATYLKALGFMCYFQVCTLGPASIITILGLIQISRRKRSLISSAGFQSASSKTLLQQIAINRQLCLLQVCEAVPVLVTAVLMAYITAAPYEMDIQKLGRMSLEDATYKEYQFEIAAYASQCLNAFHVLAHCTHFYRYVLFSSKVRKAFLRLIFKNRVDGSQSG